MSEEKFDKERVQKELKKEVDLMEGKIDFKRMYDLINQTIRKYCDLEERYYNILTLWVIGTWFHNQFPTFPYLFFNAMKGSGKSRLLKLLASMCKNGEVLASLSEAVLFRTAEFSSIFIDEFEGIGKKGSNTLRELLNAGYKRGTLVKRAFKRKTMEREEMAIECFNVYCPIAMANIYGMESVLSDRCITLILEKSDNKVITKLIENFAQDPIIQEILKVFSSYSSVNRNVSFMSFLPMSLLNLRYIDHWNTYVLGKYIYNNINDINNRNSINNKENCVVFDENEMSFFNKVDSTEIDSRHLELFLPLFVIASSISEFVLDETLKTAKQIVEERKGEDVIENRDISFYDFLAKYDGSSDFISIASLTIQFRNFIHEEDDEGKSWVTTRWLGWALRRLNLVLDKKRTGNGREVVINFGKAKEKIGMLKPKEK